MPELPEVTTTVEGLNKTARGKIIRDVWSDWKKQVKGTGFEKTRKILIGKKITSAERYGKNILIHLSSGHALLIHMKMTGHLMYGQYEKVGKRFVAKDAGPLRDDPYNRFVHFVVSLSPTLRSGQADFKHLAFSDARKFGKIKLLASDEIKTCDDLAHLGPDALSISAKQFAEVLKNKRSGRIKQVLMSQEVIAGIGNIYSDEMLWLSGIHPLTPAGKLSKLKMAKLYKHMREILKKGLKFGGDSTSDYRNIEGSPGKFHHRHSVYQMTGKKCLKYDGGVIKRIKVGGRSAHFCPVHQKLKK